MRKTSMIPIALYMLPVTPSKLYTGNKYLQPKINKNNSCILLLQTQCESTYLMKKKQNKLLHRDTPRTTYVKTL